jgi:hypothetical protein
MQRTHLPQVGADSGLIISGMADAALVRMVDAFPGLVAEIDRLLELADRSSPLVGTVGHLSYYGRCRCSPTCNILLTAQASSAGTFMIQLERDGTDVIWLSLDEACTAIVDVEVLDEAEFDLPSLEQRTT